MCVLYNRSRLGGMPESQSLQFFRRDLGLPSRSATAASMASEQPFSLADLPPRLAGEFGASFMTQHSSNHSLNLNGRHINGE